LILDMAELADGQLLNADLCIIGAGAAGISLALQFIDSGLDVIVVESGGRKREPAVQDLYAGQVERPELHPAPALFRCRQFGGSTVLWGGRCTPYDPIDFEPRSYVPHSGWPIRYEDLLPYYRDANRICEAGEFAYDISEAFGRPMRPMIEGFRSANFTTERIERFSKPTNFAARYGKALATARNVRVLLHGSVTTFTRHAGGKAIERIEVRNLSGKRVSVAAKAFVLATGGLEVARLLLANRLGNEHGNVGRYYMCHIAGTLGRIRIERPASAVWHDYDIAGDGTYCRRRLALLPERQRELGIGNFIARLHHPAISDPEHRTAILSMVFLGAHLLPVEYRTRITSHKRAPLRQYLRHAANVAREPFAAARFAWRMLRGRFLAERKIPSLVVVSKANLFSLDFHAEQVPNPDSRVMLGEEVDALGLPRIRIDWRYSPQDVETVRTSAALLAADLAASGVGRFECDPEQIEQEMLRYGAYGGHHIGTARMGDDPRSSVVNADCRLHGVENLYVAGAAVFPTSSQANPTLTIVALALRLAGHLKARLQAGRAGVVSPGEWCRLRGHAITAGLMPLILAWERKSARRNRCEKLPERGCIPADIMRLKHTPPALDAHPGQAPRWRFDAGDHGRRDTLDASGRDDPAAVLVHKLGDRPDVCRDDRPPERLCLHDDNRQSFAKTGKQQRARIGQQLADLAVAAPAQHGHMVFHLEACDRRLDVPAVRPVADQKHTHLRVDDTDLAHRFHD
jgi:choline dehydrogenase-like flavoprotein